MATSIFAPGGAPTHPQSAVTAPHRTAVDFRAWLEARQQAAIDGMKLTTGAEFGKACDAFMETTTAIRVLWNFEVEADMASGVAA